MAQEISELALRKVNRTILFGIPRRLRLYGHRKVSMHAVVKFYTNRCAGQEFPSLMARIVVRRGNELEEPSA